MVEVVWVKYASSLLDNYHCAVAPKLVYGRGGGERGSGPEGADDLCWAKS